MPRPIEKWTRPWLLALAYSAGLACGHLTAGLKHAADVARLEVLAKSMDLCDSQVLRIQKRLDEAIEAFWKAQH